MIMLNDINWKVLNRKAKGNHIKYSLNINRSDRKREVDYIIRVIVGDDKGLNVRFKAELIYSERFSGSIYAITNVELKELFINNELDKIKETIIMLNNVIIKE